MPTDKPKIIFVTDEKLMKRLDDFRFDNRINTRSEAIRRLLDEAFWGFLIGIGIAVVSLWLSPKAMTKIIEKG
jgi:hypothetical protein